jgi:hypothetical protein
MEEFDDDDQVLSRGDDSLRQWKISLFSQAALNDILESGEVVIDARPCSWWYAHRMFFGGSALGTIAFIGILLWQLVTMTLSKYFYYFLMMGMFPVLLIGAVVQGLRSRARESWIACTSERIIQYTDQDNIVSWKWTNVLAWKSFTNWLMWSKEIELKVCLYLVWSFLFLFTFGKQVRPEQVFHTTTVSRQSPFKLAYLDGLLPVDRLDVESVLRRKVGPENGHVALRTTASDTSQI